MTVSRKDTEATNNVWKIAWCHAADAGGSKRAAFEMIRELSRRGHVIDEFIIRDGEPNVNYLPLKEFVASSSQTIFKDSRLEVRPYLLELCVSRAWEVMAMWRIKRALGRLSGVMNERKYDIVHVDHTTYSKVVHVLPHLKIPSIVYSHEPSKLRYQSGLDHDGEGKGGLLLHGYRWLCSLALRCVTYLKDAEDIEAVRYGRSFLTNSRDSKERFLKRYGRMATVCHYGVDAKRFQPWDLPVEAMVLSVGRLVVAKQHHVVIEAAGMIEASRRPRVVIATPEVKNRVGDPRYAIWLEQLAEERGVNLEIHMNPSENDLVALYNNAMALVFVPIMEPFGLVALEAMACGTPVIGVREAGVRESVIDGVTGILVDRDIKQIAAAIEYLRDHDDVRRKMSQQAVEYVRDQWTWERTIDQYEDAVRQLVSSSKTVSPSRS